MSDGLHSRPEITYVNGYGIIKDDGVYRVFNDDGTDQREFRTFEEAKKHAESKPRR